jgi:uncharacterized protein YuzE
MNLQVYDDSEIDVLYLARQGREEQVVEISPGINLEYDANGELLGIEILNASSVMKQVIEPLRKRAIAA